MGRKRALDSKWSQGVWLGHNRGSSEALISTKEGVERAWTVRRKSEGENWDAEMIANLKGTPQRISEKSPGDERPTDFDGEVIEEEEPVKLRGTRAGERRSLYLQRSDFVKYGMSEDCEGCRKMATGRPAPFPHTKLCRNRIESRICEDDPDRWARAQARLATRADEAARDREGEGRKKAKASASFLPNGKVCKGPRGVPTLTPSSGRGP